MNKKFSDAAVGAAMEASRVEKGRWCIIYDESIKKYHVSRRSEVSEYRYDPIDRLGVFRTEDACREVRDHAREVAAMRAALEAAAGVTRESAAENEAHETSARRMEEAADLIEHLQVENARLREALVSFADASKMLPSALADSEFITLFNDASLDAECILGDYDASPITAGDLRRAAKLLKETAQ